MEISKKNKIFIYGLAFIIPMIILIINYDLVKIFPFGGNTILYRDLKGQYVSYFSALRDGVFHHGGLLYSFHKGLGGNMIGLISYYLMSPFNILILLIPGKYLVDAILLITVLKIGTCGITFMYFLSYKFKRLNYQNLIFSTAYALMGFNIIYQSNIMWLDAVYLLPLVIIGIDKIIDEKKKKLYVITLSLTIITGFYTGFMVCIFSVIYYLYKMFIKIYGENLKGKFFINRSIIFIICSLISGLLSLFIILPTIFELQGGKSQFAFFTTPIATDFKFVDLLSKVYINNIKDPNILNGLPSIYTGILILFFIILYFFNRNIKLHKKIASLTVFGILIISLYINKLNFIWHGFNEPQGFNYRYTFIFSFFAIYIAYIGFTKIKELKKYKLVLTGIILILPLIYFYKTPINILPKHVILINLIFVVIYTVLLFVYSIRKKEKLILCFIGIVFFIELLINGYCTFSNLPYANRKVFNYYTRTVESVTQGIQEHDKSFYRLDKNFSFNINDPMLLNYGGISEFSSMYKASLRELINSFGFINNGYWMYYGDGSTVTANSLLNIKYVISESNNNIPGFKYLYGKHGLNIYENEYYLPAGFMVNNDLLNVEVKPTDNPYVTQRKVLKSMIGKDFERCYYGINDYTIKASNLRKLSENKTGISYEKINSGKEAYLQINFIAQNNYPVYFFSEAASNIIVNGKHVGGYQYYDYKTLNLGTFKKGQKVQIKIIPQWNHLYFSNDSINYLNLNNYANDYDILKETPLNIISHTSRTINGNVTVTKNNQILYTTIPYDKGWTLYVNGKKHSYEEVLNALIGIKLPKGSYNIKLTFMPQGLVLGSVITLVTALLCILYSIMKRRKK